MEFELVLKESAKKTNIYLESCFSGDGIDNIIDAEKYSLLNGGKRIRAYLVYEFCSLFGGEEKNAIPFACAVEMIHAYSLIHDDLPCMDNDDYRRGKLTNHKVYGEAMAVLAGDALLTKAFSVCASNKCVSSDITVEAIKLLSEAAGDSGMVGGQVLDIEAESKLDKDLDMLKRIHSLKTGAMIKVSAMLGALAAGVSVNSKEMSDVIEYASKIGVAFQIVDDVLDVIGDSNLLGKNVGSDKNNDKLTYMSFYTPESALELATSLTDEAIKVISKYNNSEALVELAKYLLGRKY